MSSLDWSFRPTPEAEAVRNALLMMIKEGRPSAPELVSLIEETLGLKARWHITQAIERIVNLTTVPRIDQDYLRWLMSTGDLDAALRGSERRTTDVGSTIDELVRQSLHYRSSAAFNEMIEFMAKFREHTPYNNMLVRTQNPTCSFYASEADWKHRFERHIKEDARPLLILMPFAPVMLVYDLD